MSRLRRFLGAVAAAAALTLLASPASAADGTIAHVEGSDEGLQILVSVPPEAAIDLGGVEVSVDGQAADADAVLADTDTRIRRTSVLAIDTSESMAGARFDAAKSAALAFIDSVPDDVFVGIVTFDARVTEALAPTTDRDNAREVIDSLSLNRDTLLYDGVVSAIDLAGTEGQRSVLVLSDGADTSTTTIRSVTEAIETSEALVDVVALEQDADQIGPLQRLAEAGGGQVISADSEALSTAFSAEAAVLSSQVLVTAQIPTEVLASQATVEVMLPSSTGDVTASAYTTIRAQGEAAPNDLTLPGPPEEGWTAPDWALYAGIGVFGLGLMIGLVMLVPAKAKTLSAADRIITYTGASGSDDGDRPGKPDEDMLATAKQAMAGVLERNRGLDARITHRLEGAGSELKSSEWLLLHAAVFIGSGALGVLIGQGDPVIGIVFFLVGAVGPWVYLAIRRSRRRKAFHASLPDTLQLISGSLAAGLSLAQSMDTVVREGSEPVSSEFRRVLVETRLGVPLDDALDGVAERFESKDFEWVVMAIRIQRQVGGNLAELLDTVAATMRERQYIRRQVNALAAEGKLSAIVISALPPCFLVYLSLTQRSYVEPLFTDIRGIVMLGGALLWLLVGVFWMRKLVNIEV
ncbi:MAG TPA: type II secretion system F family protein [Candidatus Limnocylindria bacterium]|nr:type II secretion system F family protein [Candidatus Limnocylindria bacterium]